MDVTCSVDQCDKPADRKGFCQKHYMRQYRKGTTGLSGPQPKPCLTCGETFQPQFNRVVYCSDLCRRGEGKCVTCGKTFLIAKGTSGKYCSRDCWYDSAEGRMTPCPVCQTPFKGTAKTCSPDCGRELRRRTHPTRQIACLQCGDVIVGKKPHVKYCSRSCAMTHRAYEPTGGARPEGTRRPTPQRYVQVKVDGRWIMEHRYVMEQLLGRALLPTETVHHVYGDRGDNTTDGPLDERFRSGNLELWSTSQPKGQRVADKLDHAMELFRLYRPDLADLLK